MSVSLKWCAGPKEGCPLPDWARSAAMDQDGEVYMPIEAVLSPNAATRAALCAVWDGVPVAYHGEHPFAPVSWLASEYPESAPGLHVALDKVRQHFGYTSKESPQ